MTTAEIIAIGTELLLGETVDTNTNYIARVLRSLGVDLYRTQTVGDNIERISSMMRESLSRVDIVITSGGLGPTVDDPTREAAAQATGRFLEFQSDLWDQIKTRISRYGRSPTENQKRQAFLPQFSIPVNNPVGTAPTFIIELGQKALICLPGVPKELMTLLDTSIVPYLQDHFKLHEVIRIRTLQVSGVGEGVIDEKISDLEKLINPTVGLAAHSGIVSVRITAKASSSAEADRMIMQVETDLRARLGDSIFGAEGETLENVTLKALAARSWTIASLEHQTGGLLKSRLTNGALPNFVGGELLPEAPVSWEPILQGAAGNWKTDCVLGMACLISDGQYSASMALIWPGKISHHDFYFGGHPDNFQRWAVNMGLDWLRRLLL